jgi:DNA polymerase-3 subunit alpha
MKDKPVNIAGIITSVDVRLDKNGNKYARFALEDFSGSADMVVFNEDYLKYASYLEVGKMIFVKGNYEIRSKFKANYEYRIKSVQLLSSIRESEAKSIMLRMTMSQVNDQLIQRLHTICMAHPGKCYIKMSVLDEEENYFVSMKSLEFKVDSTNDLLAELAELDILSFKLGTS